MVVVQCKIAFVSLPSNEACRIMCKTVFYFHAEAFDFLHVTQKHDNKPDKPDLILSDMSSLGSWELIFIAFRCIIGGVLVSVDLV